MLVMVFIVCGEMIVFSLSLQRGEPDVYVNPDDAQNKGVIDGDLIKVFSIAGSFYSTSPCDLYHGA